MRQFTSKMKTYLLSLRESTQTSSTFESGKSTITNLGKDGGLAAKEKKAVGQLSEAFPDFKFKGVGGSDFQHYTCHRS